VSCSATSAAPTPARTAASSGKVEAADKGTLFLDEIGELPLPLQGKLLRFVQERQFERVGGRETLSADVRIVAATNRDLAAMVGAGQFRSDPYFRLRVIEIEIPPLRARGGDDITDLAAHFVDHFARRYRKGPLRLADAARPALAAYAWPGNVRELENTIQRAVVMRQGGTIRVTDLGLEPRRLSGAIDVPAWTGTAMQGKPGTSEPGRPPGDDSELDHAIRLPANLELAEAERRYARAILEHCDGNQSAAARQLGISRNKLARLLKA
jgi:DNA-binding NtrC family response regulator